MAQNVITAGATQRKKVVSEMDLIFLRESKLFSKWKILMLGDLSTLLSSVQVCCFSVCVEGL